MFHKTFIQLIVTVLLLFICQVLLFAQQNDRVGVVVHIIGDDNGHGYISEANARAAVDIASDAFDVIDIDFFVLTIRYHNNSLYTTIDEQNFDDLLNTYNLYTSSAINLYFVPNSTGNGLASLPPSRAELINLYFSNSGIVIQNDAALTSTVPHEFGHFFGLFHTYETRIGYEAPEGHPDYPNGDIAGDLIVDTAAEPDPLEMANWDENCNFSGKQYYETYPYLPGVQANSDNFMTGGVEDESCRFRFTSKQKSYMRSEFDSGERSGLRDRIWIRVVNEIDNQNAGGTYIVSSQTYPSGDYFLYPGQAVDITTGQERLQTDHKHHDWNDVDQEYKLTLEDFTGTVSTPPQFADFEEMKSATIRNFLISADSYGGKIKFHDPWFLESDGSQPDDFIEFNSPYQPTGARDEKSGGVFLNQDPNNTPVFYSVRAEEQEIDGINYFLEHWIGSNVDFEDPNAVETDVVFTGSDAVITARMKGHLASNLASATTLNNAHRLLRESNGTWHMVYEDNGCIYYTKDASGSADYGHSWEKEILLAKADETTRYHHPALAMDSWRDLHVVYEMKTPSGGDNLYRVIYHKYDSQNGWQDPILVSGDGFGWYNLNQFTTPAVWAEGYSTVYVVWASAAGIVLRRRDSNGIWENFEQLPGTDGSDITPSITRTVTTLPRTRIVWHDSQIDDIKYIEGDKESEGWFWNPVENLTSGYSGMHDVAAPTIVSRGDELHIAWHGQVNSYPYTYGNVYYLEKNSGILTTFSPAYPFGEFLEYPSVAAKLNSDKVALSYYKSDEGKVFVSTRQSGSWSTSNWGVGHYPVLNFSKETSNSPPVHMTRTTYSSEPYILASSVIFYPSSSAPPVSEENAEILMSVSQSNSQASNTEGEEIETFYFRSADIDLSQLEFNNNSVKISGGLRLDFIPDPQHMKFAEGSTRKEEFLNSEPFTGNPEALNLRLEWRTFDVEITGEIDSNELLTRIQLVNTPSGKTLDVLADFTVDDLIRLKGQAEPRIDSLSTPLAAYNGKALQIETVFYNMDPEKALYRTQVYRMNAGHQESADQKIIAVEREMPSRFALHTNYPNPFNPTTTIAFDLPADQTVILEIFDLNGRRVRTLFHDYLPAGSHQAVWDGRDNSGNSVASGVYIYRLRAGDPAAGAGQGFVQSRKMLLVK